MRLPSSARCARTTVGRARYSPTACQCRRQNHQRDFCSFVRESNPPRPLAIETELPTRGSYERMCSDTVHEARPSPPSGRRTIPIGAIRPAPRGRFESAKQSCLPLGPVRLSIGTDAAVPRTHDILSVPCSRAFAASGAPPTISCPLPAPLGTPGHHALESAESTASRRCPGRFRATSLSRISSGAMASAQCQHLLPRVAPRRVYATAITTPRRPSRQVHSDPT